ncbi:MAG: hypothetical protein Q8M07_27060 [Prosthecobacter sp.]|nr:hypothetical protein [Prosthecobacter sp.]HBJ83730.1 hypothetical protein [Verrucomicrobiales bacterium]
MNSIETLRAFLGWCSAISIGILFISTAALMLMRGPVSKLHARLFGLSADDLSRSYFQYLAHFKIAVIVFHLVPYLALRVMA